ncbi:hypothetical protein [Domibacillus iocasae]|uniref:Uncharacterized protein n=1 Tax=Domibacillus iocasae TaxID=1714016 RepID=A0A1E7DS99_9BACI|nr:hypothetical protein [Domibacillus iocasae]OES45885.1 hypothetical protein BA724_17225 [Domibacillus iocasae]
MSDKNVKGQLLNLKRVDSLRAQPVKFNDKDPFKYNANKQGSVDEEKKPSSAVRETEIKTEDREKETVRENSIKNINPKVEEQKGELNSQQKKHFEKVPASVEPPREKGKRKAVVGKNNSIKTIKVPALLHTQINMLGKFMDENKTYAILNELVENYVENCLTERQQKQFHFMSEFVQEEK